MRPRLLDLFCGAGGAAEGYRRAGFEVVGVDVKPMPRYPFEFHQGDALEYTRLHGHEFDAIHASPPCQGYSRLRHLPWLKDKQYPLLIEPTRELLVAIGVPWVIENVEDAPIGGIVLCGQMFGLPTYRHRRFLSSELILQPQHEKHKHVIGSGRMLNDRRKRLNQTYSGAEPQQIVTVAGGQFTKAEGERALGITWMTCPELAQAIPPAYTFYIGVHLLKAVLGEAA